MTHRLITEAQWDEYAFEGTSNQSKQYFNSLPELDTEGIIECLEYITRNFDVYDDEQLKIYELAHKLLAQLRKD